MQKVKVSPAYRYASNYNPDSIKYASAGNQVAYLKGDIIKVPAHWASPGSNLFIRAEADVPRGMTQKYSHLMAVVTHPMWVPVNTSSM